MTRKQASRVEMYHQVAHLLLNNTEITDELPEFEALFVLFRERIDRLWLLYQEQSINMTGVTKHKKGIREDVVQRTITLSGKVMAYATMKEDIELFKRAKLTKSELDTCADDVLLDKAATTCDIAEPLVSKLGVFKVTVEEIAGLRQEYADFKLIMPEPMKNRSNLKAVTAEVRSLMKETNALLYKLDILMQILFYSQHMFYLMYRLTRKVHIRGLRHLAMHGRITDAETGLGIAGVNLCIAKDGATARKSKAKTQPNILIKLTAAQGGYRVKTLKEGTYIVTATKEGYEPQEYTAYINKGELTVVKMGLVRMP